MRRRDVLLAAAGAGTVVSGTATADDDAEHSPTAPTPSISIPGLGWFVQPTTVRITDVSDGVYGGESISITAVIANRTPDERDVPVELVSTGQRETVNETTVTIPGYDAVVVTLGYETWPVRTDVEFPMAVRTPHDYETTQVVVYGLSDDERERRQGPVTVSIHATNSPLAAGDVLRVAPNLANNGELATTTTVELVSAGEVVDSRDVRLAGHSTQITELTFETYPVQTDVQFDVTVRTPDDSATAAVRVYADGVPDDEAEAADSDADGQAEEEGVDDEAAGTDGDEPEPEPDDADDEPGHDDGDGAEPEPEPEPEPDPEPDDGDDADDEPEAEEPDDG